MLYKFISFTILLFLSTNAYGQKSLADTEVLKEFEIFDKIKIKLPAHLKHPKDNELIKKTKIYRVESEDESIFINIRIKGPTDLKLIQTTHERMATSFYKGEIHRSEFVEINERTVYIFEMTGYWNGSKQKESWMKFFSVDKDGVYQCLIKFPAQEYNLTKELREEILSSFKVE